MNFISDTKGLQRKFYWSLAIDNSICNDINIGIQTDSIKPNLRTTMINLKLSKAKAKHLLEILGYMQQNVFDGLWHDEQLTADQLTKTIKSKIKEL